MGALHEMRIDVFGLQAFVTIAERGSFHAAASHLNLSQTALSHRIRKLEESLGVPLLMRTTRRVALTANGVALLPKAKAMFEDIGGALDDIRLQHVCGEKIVSLACLPTVAHQCLPAAIRAFALERPDVRVRVHDNPASEIAEKVQSGEADFGVTIVATNRWDLDLKPVAKEPFVLVCHAEAELAGATMLSWADLRGLPLIRISAETGNRVLIDDALGARRETLSWRYEVQRATTAVSLVGSGVGYTIVPQLAFDVVRSRDLVAIALHAPTVTRTLGIVTRKDVALSPEARHLRSLLVSTLKASFLKTTIAE